MSSDSSTLKSYVDSAIGTAQSAIGSVTGNPADQVHFPPHEQTKHLVTPKLT